MTAKHSGFSGPLSLVGLTALAAVAGSLGSLDAPALYAQMLRPAWAPPGWLFGPAWTVLYTLMAIAATMVWRAHGWRAAAWPLGLYAVQLVANALWSWVFFAWRSGGWAFINVIALWLLVAATALAFRPLHRGAAWLMLPYLSWVSYAAALTWSVWQRNPALLGG